MNTFYCENIPEGTFHLSLEESKHCIKVLRYKKGERINVTDGRGKLIIAILLDENHKGSACMPMEDISPKTKKKHFIHIALAPTKNIDRMEWFVEKAGELGVDEITFIKTQNSERPVLKLERLERKAISALKQSKSKILVKLNEMITIEQFLKLKTGIDQKFIAAVKEDLPYFSNALTPEKSVLVLIGPEGDFTDVEFKKALEIGFNPVSLGNNVLRTETAGIVCGQFINMVNQY